MFTGIIQALGQVVSCDTAASGRTLCLDGRELAWESRAVGSSIAVNGVCLSVTKLNAPCFWVDVTHHSLSLSNLGRLRKGDAVNLEGAMNLGTPLDGHLVTGHVDGMGEVLSLDKGARAGLAVRTPPELLPYLCERGSIAVDGVSLTVSSVQGSCFQVALIPHTLSHTTLGHCVLGAQLNLEVDLVARYLARLLETQGLRHAPGGTLHGAS